jgi:hypothetical protein
LPWGDAAADTSSTSPWGKAGTTSGTRVMVEAWKAAIEPLPGTNQQPADGSHSGIDVVSCRTAEGSSILKAGSFRLEMDDGARLEPVGSRLRVAGAKPNCLPATIVFRTDGRKPTHVRYEGGSTTLRWAVP